MADIATLATALHWGIRPEHIVLSDTPTGLDARIQTNEQLGSDSYLYCELQTGQTLTVHRPGQTSIRRGDSAALRLPPEHCHVFRTDDRESAVPGSVQQSA